MIETTLCYIEKDNKYLMLHRIKKENDINRDKWIGIGGKFEKGETKEECLLREAKEETGLTLTDYRYRGVVHFCPDTPIYEVMHLYTAHGFEGKIKETCDEGSLEWIDKKDLFALTLWEGDKIFLKLIEKTETPFFTLSLSYDGDRLTQAILDGKEIKSL
ncbi:MAG: 8-oxo-dGTP diphosphatase [Clostridia bacterium]|nr:8-oxo-dGTP diphosphatase [Clostridia bacterium]